MRWWQPRDHGKRIFDLKIMFGVDVMVNGKWMHAHVAGKPCIYRTELQAQRMRETLRKRKSEQKC